MSLRIRLPGAVATIAMGLDPTPMMADQGKGGVPVYANKNIVDNAANSKTQGVASTRKGPDPPAPTEERAPPSHQPGPDWITWHLDPLSNCNQNCAITIYGGREISTSMERIFITEHLPPWKWKYGNGGFVGTTFSRRLATFLNVIEIEPEFGIGKRFGNVRAVEIWGALYFRWTYFPWNEYLKTTIGVNTGLNYATDIEAEERQRSVPGHKGSHILHNFSPEITFALPAIPNVEVVVNYHHRSGVYGLINGVYGGTQFATLGLRYRF
jgi:hypothetical protein